MAAYTEEDLIHHGKDYDHGLPNMRAITDVDTTVKLAGEWVPEQGMQSAAYCVYSFSVAGYDREDLLQLKWQTAPVEPELLYLGLSNWDEDTWEWQQYDGADTVSTGSMDAYISETDILLLAVVYLANNDDATLEWIRIGAMPAALAQLDTSAAKGVAPVVLSLVGFNSDPGVGEIENFEWDYDGDGTYDSDGPINFDVHSYETAGEYSPSLQITTEYGVQATDSEALTVVDGWMHSFGTNSDDYYKAVVTDGTNVYCAGATTILEHGYEGLLTKYSLDGTFVWARATGFENEDDLLRLVIHPNGDLFAMGRTSYGIGLDNLLLQRWNDDGTVDWTRVYSPEYWGDHNWSDIAVYGDYLYAVGHFDLDDDFDAMIACFDLDGNLHWVKRFGFPGHQMGRSVAVTEPGAEPVIHVASSTPMPGGNTGILYCRFSTSGVLLEATGYEADNTVSVAAMLVSAIPPGTFFTGYYTNSSEKQNIFLLKLEEPGPAALTAWSKTQMDSAHGDFILAEDGLLVIGGDAYGLGDQWRPVLMRTTATGTALGMQHIGADGTKISSYNGCKALDSGCFMVGRIKDSFAGQWTSDSLSSWSIPGTWSTMSVTVTNVQGAVTSPEPSLTYLTAGNHDSADASGDAVVMLTATPW